MSKRTVIDAAAVAGMALLLGVDTVTARQDPATASAPRVIEIVARRVAFEPAKIDVTEGEALRLMVRFADGVNGIEIRKFNINKPVPRSGRSVQIDPVAPAPGAYDTLCAEYCGEGHEGMQATFVVQAQPR
jgi:cytochrome c oxidase subunit 2